jgi:branched-chain amino acid transport system substrate-binding protein
VKLRIHNPREDFMDRTSKSQGSLSLLFAFGASVALAFTASVSAQTPETIKIGTILPMTGPASDAGNQEKQGMILLVDSINARGGIRGRKLELLVEDNQGKPESAVVAFNKLVDLEKVQVLVVGFTGPTLAMAPLATRKKIVLINGGAQGDKLNNASPYLFNAMPLLNMELSALARFAKENIGSKAAILYQNDATGVPGRDNFRAAFTALGGTIVAEEAISFGETNFRAALAKVAHAQPEFLFTIMTQNYPQLAEQKLQQKLQFQMVTNTNINTPDAIGNPATAGFYYTAFKLEAPAELTAEYRKRFGVDMGFYSRQFYNALSIATVAIDKVIADGRPVTGENIRETILAIRTFKGLSGDIVFKTNTAEMDISINQIRDGKGVLVKTMK